MGKKDKFKGVLEDGRLPQVAVRDQANFYGESMMVHAFTLHPSART